jgi:hypothetical protein
VSSGRKSKSVFVSVDTLDTFFELNAGAKTHTPDVHYVALRRHVASLRGWRRCSKVSRRKLHKSSPTKQGNKRVVSDLKIAYLSAFFTLRHIQGRNKFLERLTSKSKFSGRSIII